MHIKCTLKKTKTKGATFTSCAFFLIHKTKLQLYDCNSIGCKDTKNMRCFHKWRIF